MILVDTSILIDHLRRGDAAPVRLLNDNAVLAHPSVTGELALGDLHHRDEVSSSLHGPPKAVVAGAMTRCSGWSTRKACTARVSVMWAPSSSQRPGHP